MITGYIQCLKLDGGKEGRERQFVTRYKRYKPVRDCFPVQSLQEICLTDNQIISGNPEKA